MTDIKFLETCKLYSKYTDKDLIDKLVNIISSLPVIPVVTRILCRDFDYFSQLNNESIEVYEIFNARQLRILNQSIWVKNALFELLLIYGNNTLNIFDNKIASQLDECLEIMFVLDSRIANEPDLGLGYFNSKDIARFFGSNFENAFKEHLFLSFFILGKTLESTIESFKKAKYKKVLEINENYKANVEDETYENYQENPFAKIELKNVTAATTDVFIIIKDSLNINNVYLDKENRSKLVEFSLNFEDIQIKIKASVENNEYKEKYFKWGQKLEEKFLGQFCININNNFYLIPYLNLSYNLYTFSLFFNLQRSAGVEIAEKLDWQTIQKNFEQYVRNYFLKLKDLKSLDRKYKDGELADVLFTYNGYVFIGESKLFTITDFNSTDQGNEKPKGLNTISYEVLKDKLKKVYTQRTKRQADFLKKYPDTDPEKIINFAVLPSFFDLESTAAKIAGENIRTSIVNKMNNFEDCVDVVIVPYSKIEEFANDPLKYAQKSGYLNS